MKAMFSTYINGLCNIKPMYFPFEKYQCFLNLEFDDFRHEYYMNGIETSNGSVLSMELVYSNSM